MARIELTPVPGLSFEPVGHTYDYNGQELQGITTALHNQLCPDEFNGVNPEIMAKATERGHRIHEAIQNFVDNFESDDSVELMDFIKLTQDYNLNFEKSELLMTDFQNYASSADLVVRESEDTISIGDIKTYGTMTPEKQLKLQFQLSIYAYMAELCWPGIRIDKLFCIHLRNTEKEHVAEIIYVKRIDASICKALLQAELDGTQFENPLLAIPEDIQSQEDRIRELILLKQQCEVELNDIKASMLQRMEDLNVKTWTFGSGLKATRKMASIRQSLDTAKLKAEHKEINFDSYIKTSMVNGSLQLTMPA